MVRRLFTPAWLALHVLAIAVFVALAELGLWQWHRARDTGRVQNYSYALEWWLFTAFAVFLWVKEMVDALEDRPAPVEDAAAPAASAPVVVDTYDDDPELAAYNARLAELHARDQAGR